MELTFRQTLSLTISKMWRMTISKLKVMRKIKFLRQLSQNNLAVAPDQRITQNKTLQMKKSTNTKKKQNKSLRLKLTKKKWEKMSSKSMSTYSMREMYRSSIILWFRRSSSHSTPAHCKSVAIYILESFLLFANAKILT